MAYFCVKMTIRVTPPWSNTFIANPSAGTPDTFVAQAFAGATHTHNICTYSRSLDLYAIDNRLQAVVEQY